jgi:hypothetical protein
MRQILMNHLLSLKGWASVRPDTDHYRNDLGSQWSLGRRFRILQSAMIWLFVPSETYFKI